MFRGSPLLVQIFLIYYGLGQFPAVRQSLLWPFLRQPWWCALLALSLNTAAYGAEVIRGGLLAVPRGQIEAGRVCGMSTFRCTAASSCRWRCARRCRPTATRSSSW